MRYLHTMIRITDIEASLDFYCNKLGLVETRRVESAQGRFTLIFLAAPQDVSPWISPADFISMSELCCILTHKRRE